MAAAAVRAPGYVADAELEGLLLTEPHAQLAAVDALTHALAGASRPATLALVRRVMALAARGAAEQDRLGLTVEYFVRRRPGGEVGRALLSAWLEGLATAAEGASPAARVVFESLGPTPEFAAFAGAEVDRLLRVESDEARTRHVRVLARACSSTEARQAVLRSLMACFASNTAERLEALAAAVGTLKQVLGVGAEQRDEWLAAFGTMSGWVNLVNASFDPLLRDGVVSVLLAAVREADVSRSRELMAAVIGMLGDPSLRATAIPLISSLVRLSRDGVRAMFREEGGIREVVTRLTDDTLPLELRNGLVLSLWHLSFDLECRRWLLEDGAVPPLVRVIAVAPADSEAMSKSAGALWNLADSDEGKAAIRAAQGVMALLHALERPEASDDTRMRSAGALLTLSFDRAILEDIRRQDGVRRVVKLLRVAHPDTRTRAAGLIWNLAALPGVPAEALELGVLPLLVSLVETGTADGRMRATGALLQLSFHSEFRDELVRRNGIGLMIPLLSDAEVETRGKAAGVLWNLCSTDTQRGAFLAAGGVAPLVRLLAEAPSEDARLRAAGAVWNLSFHSDAAQALIAARATPALVASLIVAVDRNLPAILSKVSGALWNLAATGDAIKSQLVTAGVVPRLLRAVELGDDEGRPRSVGALLTLSFDRSCVDALASSEATFATLVRFLSDTVDDVRAKTAGVLWNLANDDRRRAQVVRAGAVPPLVRVIRDGSAESRMRAVGALWMLSFDGACRRAILDAGGVAPVATVLADANNDARAKAAGCLWNLAELSDAKKTVLQNGGVTALIRTLGDTHADAVHRAAGALLTLSFDDECLNAILRGGAVEPAVRALKVPVVEGAAKAAGLVWNLATKESARPQLLRAGAVGALVPLLYSEVEDARLRAAGALLQLSFHSDTMDEIRRQPTILPALVSVLKVATPDTRAKASGLLWNWASTPEFRLQLVNAGVVEPLVRALETGFEDALRRASGALASICAGCTEAARVVERSGGIPLLCKVVEATVDDIASLALGALEKLAEMPDLRPALRSAGVRALCTSVSSRSELASRARNILRLIG